jgi:hypothetical protein
MKVPRSPDAGVAMITGVIAVQGPSATPEDSPEIFWAEHCPTRMASRRLEVSSHKYLLLSAIFPTNHQISSSEQVS